MAYRPRTGSLPPIRTAFEFVKISADDADVERLSHGWESASFWRRWGTMRSTICGSAKGSVTAEVRVGHRVGAKWLDVGRGAWMRRHATIGSLLAVLAVVGASTFLAPGVSSATTADCALTPAPDVDLSGCDLSGATWSGADLTGADLSARISATSICGTQT